MAHSLSWAVPILALIGLSVSLYLSYVEVARVEAVCGPVGACNIVQTSVYASLLGIPIAVLGALNYMAIIALWAGQHFLSRPFSGWRLARPHLPNTLWYRLLHLLNVNGIVCHPCHLRLVFGVGRDHNLDHDLSGKSPVTTRPSAIELEGPI